MVAKTAAKKAPAAKAAAARPTTKDMIVQAIANLVSLFSAVILSRAKLAYMRCEDAVEEPFLSPLGQLAIVNWFGSVNGLPRSSMASAKEKKFDAKYTHTPLFRLTEGPIWLFPTCHQEVHSSQLQGTYFFALNGLSKNKAGQLS